MRSCRNSTKRARGLFAGSAFLALVLTCSLAGCKSPSKRLVEPDATPRAKPPTGDTGDSGDSAAVPGEKAYETAKKTESTYWAVVDRGTAVADGFDVLRKHECTRCHEIDEQEGHGRAFDCVSCHVFMKGLPQDTRRYNKLTAKHGKAIIDGYVEKIVHQLVIPNLDQISNRVRPEWIGEFLPAPYDVRPSFDESMIRNQLTKPEIQKLVRYFAAIATDAPDPYAEGYVPRSLPPKPLQAWIDKGKALFVEKACNTCHTFGNVNFGYDAKYLLEMKETTQLAPNLRFARDKVRPDKIVDWIIDPQAVVPAATMTKLEISREEAAQIASYLFYGDAKLIAEPVDAKALLQPPPMPDRDVSWEEAKKETLGHVCVHCHMNDQEKDTGPGNRGGLGYPGIALGFRTYERSMWGAEDKDTKRRYSVFQKRPGEKRPRIIEALLVRRVENLRDDVPPFEDRKVPGWGGSPRLGMPLGLPALSDEKIGILMKWIERDCPGQDKVTGKPGFTDGFLVPDGPIEKNTGCELRAPADPPPSWSSKPRGGAKPADKPAK